MQTFFQLVFFCYRSISLVENLHRFCFEGFMCAQLVFCCKTERERTSEIKSELHEYEFMCKVRRHRLRNIHTVHYTSARHTMSESQSCRKSSRKLVSLLYLYKIMLSLRIMIFYETFLQFVLKGGIYMHSQMQTKLFTWI